jgi:hypothetical protein
MKPAEKATLIALVRASPLPRKQVLAQLGLPWSTYYDWCRRRSSRLLALEDRPSGSKPPWNRLRPEEVQAILALARASPELSPRELALRITDAGAFPSPYRSPAATACSSALAWSNRPRCWASPPRRSTTARPRAPTRCGPPMAPT